MTGDGRQNDSPLDDRLDRLERSVAALSEEVAAIRATLTAGASPSRPFVKPDTAAAKASPTRPAPARRRSEASASGARPVAAPAFPPKLVNSSISHES